MAHAQREETKKAATDKSKALVIKWEIRSELRIRISIVLFISISCPFK